MGNCFSEERKDSKECVFLWEPPQQIRTCSEQPTTILNFMKELNSR
jgi:hypothetical protein